jgi:hypothetical protein
VGSRKGTVLVLVSILIFAVFTGYAAGRYMFTGVEADPLEDKAWEAMNAVRNGHVLMETQVGVPGIFNPEKVASYKGEDFRSDLESEGVDTEGFEFQLEIEEISDSTASVSRSVLGGDAIQTSKPPSAVGKGEIAEIESSAALYFSPGEVHGAKLTLRVWR